MKRALVPAIATVLALALVGLLAYGLLSRSADDTIEQSVARGEFPPAPSLTLPVLERAHRALQASGQGTVLGVTYQNAAPASLRFVEKHATTFPNVRDVETTLAKRYGTRNVPETFVIDRRGRIVDLYRGQIDQAFIDRALAKVQ